MPGLQEEQTVAEQREGVWWFSVQMDKSEIGTQNHIFGESEGHTVIYVHHDLSQTVVLEAATVSRYPQKQRVKKALIYLRRRY